MVNVHLPLDSWTVPSLGYPSLSLPATTILNWFNHNWTPRPHYIVLAWSWSWSSSCGRQSVDQFVLVSGLPLGPMTRFYLSLLFSFDNYFVVLPRAPSLTRGRVSSLQCNHWLVRSLRPITTLYRLIIRDCVPFLSPLTTRRDYGGSILTRLQKMSSIVVCFLIAGEMCPQSCSLVMAVVLSPVYTAVIWYWVYMSEYFTDSNICLQGLSHLLVWSHQMTMNLRWYEVWYESFRDQEQWTKHCSPAFTSPLVSFYLL
jgi:hypothetical protein